MHYIIQENVFRERHYDLLEKALVRLGLPYTTVRLFPFVDKIVALDDIPNEEGAYNVDDLPAFVPPTDNVWCFGAIKLARIAATMGWKPGSMMNDRHDYMVYSEYWKDNLLNYDSKIYKVTDSFDWAPGEIKFIRPTQDTKAFTGQEFTEEEWKDSVEHALHNFKSPSFNEETLVQVSRPKAIHKEIRCWVVNGKVITASTYRVANEFNINGQVFPEEIEFAQKMVDLFQLNEAFVIDICQSDQGLKIVEAGCINCAGFYNADLASAVCAIDDHFDQERRKSSVIDGPRDWDYQ